MADPTTDRTLVSLNKVGEIRNQDPTLYQALLEIRDRVNAILLEEPAKVQAQVDAAIAGLTSSAIDVVNSVAQAIPDITATALSFDTVNLNTGADLTLSGGNVVRILNAGWYSFSVAITWAGAIGGTARLIFAAQNTVTQLAGSTSPPLAPGPQVQQTVAAAAYFAKNDTLTFFVYQNSGAPLNVTGGAGNCSARVWRR